MQHSANGTTRAAVGRKASAPQRAFRGVVASLVGHVVTVVTSESFEDAPVGRHLRSGTYRARVQSVGDDHVVLLTQYEHRAKSAGSEPVKQFVPLDRIQRISMMKSELLLHL